MPNFLGARQRAKDAKKKAELIQVKSALRLYYNDYQTYPDKTAASRIKGCGANADEECPKSGCSAEFAAGSSACGDTIYMKKLPSYTTWTMNYYQVSSGENFCLKVGLENVSDPDILASQQRCGNKAPYSGPCEGLTINVSSNEYVVCAD